MGDSMEWIDRTFTPEGDMPLSSDEKKRRAETAATEDATAADAAAKAGVENAIASGAVKKVDETSSVGIVGKLQSIFTSPSGVLGKARTASRKLLS